MATEETNTGDNALLQAILLAEKGELATARTQLQKIVEQNPDNEMAWFYLAGIADTKEDATRALDEVSRINPDHPQLAKAKAWASQKWRAPSSVPSQAKTSAETPTKPTTPIVPQKKTGKRRLLILGTSIIAIALIAFIAFFALNYGNFIAIAPTPIIATPTQTSVEIFADLQRQLDTARANGNQSLILDTLEQMHAVQPDNATTASELATLYYKQGLVFRNAGKFAEAQTSFAQAIAVLPEFESAKTEAKLADLYVQGAKHHQNAEWDEAATIFEEIYAQSPNYPYVDEILYSTYYNIGLFDVHQNELESALIAYQRAADILPSAPEAPQKVDEVYLLLHPPTPTPTPTPLPTATPYPTSTPKPVPPTATPVPIVTMAQKEIIVDISEQRTYIYQNGVLINQFIVSTGEPGRDTAPGHYQVLNKIPVAYASTWDLDMPYWLGIYWAGPLQNGFHALPTVRHNGYTLWDGYLGQRVSYGCIILSLADAETLYYWADIGTPVTIRW